MKGLSSLDTSATKTAFNPLALESHERFGVGELYQFGATSIELYPGLGETAPVVRLRMPGGLLAFSNVVAIKPSEDGGVLIDCAMEEHTPHCSITINKKGDVAFLYSPPATMTVSQNGVTRTIRGREYTQSTIDIEGTAEGVRVQIKGKVDAAPRLLDAKNQKSPLTFFLIEDNPRNPKEPVYHEIWASNKVKQELKALKLVKDTVIEAILFRHKIDIELQNHERVTLIRHNLVKVIYVEGRRPHSAKRQSREE